MKGKLSSCPRQYGEGQSLLRTTPQLGLNLGRCQHAVVDAEFVEQPAERIIARQVADRHDMARIVCFQGLRRRGGQRAVHVELQRLGAVGERHGDMVPGRIGDRAGEGVAGAEGTEGQLVAGIEIELLTTQHPRGDGTRAEEMPLGAAQCGAFDPGFQREIGRAEVVGPGIGDRDGIVEAVEGQGLAIGGLASDPGGPVDQRAGVAAARGIGQRGPAPFVHPVGRHEVGHGRGVKGMGASV